MGYGIASAAGVQGGYDELKQMLVQRMQQAAMAQQLQSQRLHDQLAVSADQRANRQLDETSALRRATEADAAKQKTYGEANTLGEQLQPGTELMPQSPAVATMQAGGRGDLLQPRMTLPSTQMSGGATMPGGDAPMTGYLRTTTRTEAKPEKFIKTATAKQADTIADNQRQSTAVQAGIDAKIEGLRQAAEHLRMQGEVNAANILRAQAEAAAANARAQATANKPSGVSLSQAGKSARAAIEQAGPLTDQVLEMIRKEAPDIEANPDKYNTISSKLSAIGQTLKYKAGFHDDTDPRQQLVSLLQPIQAGQYTRSSRSRQMLDLALKHMADPSQTLLTQYQRAKELKSIMPEMLEGIVRAEQPVDPSNPLGGSYFDPKRDAAGGSGGGMVPMVAPDGRALSVPADKVAELEAKGAKRR